MDRRYKASQFFIFLSRNFASFAVEKSSQEKEPQRKPKREAPPFHKPPLPPVQNN
jgi:hypothetical protein